MTDEIVLIGCGSTGSRHGKNSAIKAASRIRGWMTADELGWLYDHAFGKGLVVEVGSYQGRSTKVLAVAVAPGGGAVFAVDNGAGSPHAEIFGDDMLKVLTANLVEEIAAGIVFVMWQDSVVASLAFESESADMIFIDGAHQYDGVLRDLKAWRPKLKPGGVLCGHDYGGAGVGTALKDMNIPVIVAQDSIWEAR